ncbi:MAG: hypothetical protein E6265_01985 [Enterobacteriaceae bacterium]|nr:hypothetical protein [Enterobacteriaceae bacterium]
MKLIKCWNVKLYRNLSKSIFSDPMEKLIFEGYSKDKPRLKIHDEGLIELFTEPDQLETKTIRTYGIDSMVCTPVYEEDEVALNPPRAEMLEYVKAAIGEGYQPENEEAITDLSLIDALNDNDLNREFGKCWQWYDMGGGLHETFEKQVHFEEHKEDVIKAIGHKAIGCCSEKSAPDSNKHALKSNFFTIEFQIPTEKDLNKIFFEVCDSIRCLTPSHDAFRMVFDEMLTRVRDSVLASITIRDEFFHSPNAMRGKAIKPIQTLAYEQDDKAAADEQKVKVHDHACVNCFTDKGPCLGECNITDTNKALVDSFEAVTKPVIKWLNDNSNPHAIIHIYPTSATLHTGEIGYSTEEFLKD